MSQRFKLPEERELCSRLRANTIKLGELVLSRKIPEFDLLLGVFPLVANPSAEMLRANPKVLQTWWLVTCDNSARLFPQRLYSAEDALAQVVGEKVLHLSRETPKVAASAAVPAEGPVESDFNLGMVGDIAEPQLTDQEVVQPKRRGRPPGRPRKLT